MFPLTPDQHHWLEVATEDEGWTWQLQQKNVNKFEIQNSNRHNQHITNHAETVDVCLRKNTKKWTVFTDNTEKTDAT